MTYDSRFKNEETELFFDAILSLGDKETCYRFFEDVSTVNELAAMAQRFHIAKLLSEEHTYAEIEAKTKASTATISRINRCLRYGADGYKKMLAKLSEKC
ncbi:MAG: TrpR-like protein YerC/YecD [Clostridiales Family XIII bacterium]|jgi:TrpR-related protein YerC/YecD|nr:TrpR-like protein YerC/YecD [Clostridiales Family XIII bacterium]